MDEDSFVSEDSDELAKADLANAEADAEIAALQRIKKKEEEETNDVGDMTNEEQPVAIEERNDNPDEGDMTFIEQITDDGLRVVNPTGNVTPHSSFIEEPPITEQPSSTTSEELNEKNDEFLEHIEPEHQCSYLSEEFMQNLNNKHNTRKIEKKNARDKL